ncbi:competence type IV pilus minor pilin ComGF [Paucilactobacillus kaifaensis]|uniref:competence type IV pilus minor pilin ComGF n=1 Tax=Paucilactobacillus kaifaensis TaxID=2559921 RepID=UPI0010F9B3EA|nr:competence type IV pilus minor pilin ComGF [Paucilactobacillus kaifaensis]
MKKSGFTLIECILALLITSMVAMLIGLFLHSFQKNDHQTIDESAQWYLFLRELESPTHQFQLMSCSDHRLMLNSPISVKYYQLNGKSTHLYLSLQENGGGYLPLLDRVKDFHAQQISDRQVELKVETLSGHKYDNIVIFNKFMGENNE